MFYQKFSMCLSALDLLKVKEQGTISHFRNGDDNILGQLQNLGLAPGLPIRLERRHPNWVVRVGQTLLTIDRDLARSIYVRIHHRG